MRGKVDMAKLPSHLKILNKMEKNGYSKLQFFRSKKFIAPKKENKMIRFFAVCVAIILPVLFIFQQRDMREGENEITQLKDSISVLRTEIENYYDDHQARIVFMGFAKSDSVKKEKVMKILFEK